MRPVGSIIVHSERSADDDTVKHWCDRARSTSLEDDGCGPSLTWPFADLRLIAAVPALPRSSPVFPVRSGTARAREGRGLVVAITVHYDGSWTFSGSSDSRHGYGEYLQADVICFIAIVRCRR